MSDEDRQDYVIGLVSQINHVLAGENMAEACTALTLAVTCQIIATETDGRKGRIAQARTFASHLEDFIRRDDIAEWIRASITPIAQASSRRKQ